MFIHVISKKALNHFLPPANARLAQTTADKGLTMILVPPDVPTLEPSGIASR
jgi:FtsP/CotA-like multicopper oxidase with cupredoxin domain